MQLFYKFLFVVLIISYATYSIELSFVVSSIAILFTSRSKLNKYIFYSIIFLLIIFLIGFLRSVSVESSVLSKIKDYVYFFRPILVLLATYLTVIKIKDNFFVHNTIVFIASIIAFYHLFTIVININSLANYTSLRLVAGKQNHIEVVALVIMTFTNYFNQHNNVNRNIKIALFIMLNISVILYFSRTMFVIYFIFFLAYKGYIFFNKKLLKGLAVITILAIISILIFNNMNFKEGTNHSNNFTYKIYNSVNELFESVNLSKIKNDKNNLWEHWRAYEAAIAIDNISTSDNYVANTIFGMGFGSNIDLQTDVKLDGEIYKEVPSIHNGYVNIYYKTGLLGIITYIFFIIYSYLSSNVIQFKEHYLKSLYVGSIFYIVYNSFVITGFLRPGEFSLVILAIVLGLNKISLNTNQ
jgi:hypothetical protein